MFRNVMSTRNMTSTTTPPSVDHGAPDPSTDGTSTSSRGTRVLGVLCIVGLAVLGVFTFAISPPDSNLGDSVRIMYIHVPTVAWAYLCLICCAASSVTYLVRRSRFADVLAHASAEIGVLLLGVTLVSGAAWGHITWGTYWEWDARLTTTLLLFLMFVGYLALRAVPPSSNAGPGSGAVRAAVVGTVSALMIPVVHKSVEWWASLHQGATSFGTLDGNIEGSQQFTLWLSFGVGSLVAVWLLMHRFRVGWLTAAAQDVALDEAIEARRAGAAGRVADAGAGS